MKFIYLFALSLILSCTFKTVPLKGNYSDGNFEGYSEKSKEVVWDNIIDFFAKNGLSIHVIDKSSGLITSGKSLVPYTKENSKGELINKDAWVVIHKIIDPGSRKSIAYYNVTAEWNVRIKEMDSRTVINVNLVNPSYAITDQGASNRMFNKGSFQSTGVFEKLIYDKVK